MDVETCETREYLFYTNMGYFPQFFDLIPRTSVRLSHLGGRNRAEPFGYHGFIINQEIEHLELRLLCLPFLCRRLTTSIQDHGPQADRDPTKNKRPDEFSYREVVAYRNYE